MLRSIILLQSGNIENIIEGKNIDSMTRCTHYNSESDIIAIKFKCCQKYYACYYCHEECTTHKAERWEKKEFNTKAVLCGSCKQEMTITEYLNSDYKCPNCNALFNPNCSVHYHLYFEMK